MWYNPAPKGPTLRSAHLSNDFPRALLPMSQCCNSSEELSLANVFEEILHYLTLPGVALPTRLCD